VGELEAHTEAGNRAAETRGYRLVHLFDCLHDGSRSLVSEPYRARRDALYRMQSEVVNLGCELPWYRDRHGDAHSVSTGRYVEARATDWRLAPVVPQMPVGRVEELWADVDRGVLEGVVCVNLDAPAGRRSAKLKCKPSDSIDCPVVSVTRTQVVCSYAGSFFAVGRGRHDVSVGSVVEVRHSGWYETVSIPRFATIARVRGDLA
jgi:ATP-dependent DNA ligase